MLSPGDAALLHFKDNTPPYSYHDSVYLISIANSLTNTYSSLRTSNYRSTVKHQIKADDIKQDYLHPLCSDLSTLEAKLNHQSIKQQQTGNRSAPENVVGKRPLSRELAHSTSANPQSITYEDSDSLLRFITTASYSNNLHRALMSSPYDESMAPLESFTTESPFLISSGAIESLQQDQSSDENSHRHKSRKRKQYLRVTKRQSHSGYRAKRELKNSCEKIHQHNIELSAPTTSTVLIPRFVVTKSI